MANWKYFVRNFLLSTLAISSILLALTIRYAFRFFGKEWSTREAMYLRFPGEIYMRILTVLVVPLSVTSVISALAGLKLPTIKRIAFWSFVYYTITTTCAIILGLILVFSIKPGVKGMAPQTTIEEIVSPRPRLFVQDIYLDVIRNIFPPNVIQAFIQKMITSLEPPKSGTDFSLSQWEPVESYTSSTNILGLLIFSVSLGITLSHMGKNGKIIVDFINTLNSSLIGIAKWLTWLSPLGIFFILVGQGLETNTLLADGHCIHYFIITVILGLIIHGCGVVMALYFLTFKKLPGKMLLRLGQVLATTFGTGSSTLTMSFTIRTLDKIELNPMVTRFIIPLGASINLNGTALYDMVALIFAAQLGNVPMTFTKVVLVCLTTLVASIGTGNHSSTIINFWLLVDVMHMPLATIGYLLAFDWLLMRVRATVNVLSDCMCVSFVDQLIQPRKLNDQENECEDGGFIEIF